MELDLGTIAILVVGIFYLGGTLNKILAKSGASIEKRYDLFDKEQSFDIKVSEENLKVKVQEFQKKSKTTMTDEELNEFLGL
jgi:Zn-finger nucleic acid-binding protein